ncbi:hypothetical protein [Streptomyces sp. KR55]
MSRQLAGSWAELGVTLSMGAIGASADNAAGESPVVIKGPGQA